MMESMFEDIELIRMPFKITWEYIGEGHEGDYDLNDPEDEQLLRFSVDKWNEQNNEWEGIQDGSYCTQMPIETDFRVLVRGLAEILYNLNEDSSNKKYLESMSWLSPEDFKEKTA